MAARAGAAAAMILRLAPLLLVAACASTPTGPSVMVLPGSGKSTCNGGCAALWPPAMAAASDQPAGAYTIVMRDDGARQWAYKGKPVYTYQADQKPGDRAGDNFKDVWHIIKD